MKYLKLFEQFVNEAIELVHVYDTDGSMHGTGELVKTKGKKSLVRWDGSREEWFPSELVKLVESNVNEAKKLDRDTMMSWFKSKGRDFVKTSDEFNGEESGIWLSREDDDKHIDHTSTSSKFDNSVLKSFRKQAADRGWEITFHDRSTIMVWPDSNEAANEAAVNVTPESDVVIDDYMTDNGDEIKATEIVGALVSSKTEDEYTEYFYTTFGQGAFTEADMFTLIKYYNEYLEELNADEVEAEEAEEEDPLADAGVEDIETSDDTEGESDDDDPIEDELAALEK